MANLLAYGFVGLTQIFSQRVTEVNFRVFNDAIALSLQEHNRVLNELLDAFVARITIPQERFRLPGGGTLQPLDEDGNPIPFRFGAFQDIAFPLQGGGTAWGTNRVSRETMTVEEANNYQVTVQQQDADWMRRHILAALLDNTSWTYGDPDVGDLTILPLANGDAQQYMLTTGVMATANHYLATADAIADVTNPYPTIYDTLTNKRGNSGPWVAYVADNLRADTEALANFVPVGDSDITLGASSDRLATPPAQILGFGDEIIGKVDGLWIVVSNRVPSSYIIAMALGATTPALGMRQYPMASLQGLFEEAHSPDGGHRERRFIRYAGFGGRNRVAAVIQQIGNATYQIPSGFATPLPA